MFLNIQKSMNTSTSTSSNLFDININDILDDELNLNFDESNPILTNEDTNIENEFLAFLMMLEDLKWHHLLLLIMILNRIVQLKVTLIFEEYLKEDYEETDVTIMK